MEEKIIKILQSIRSIEPSSEFKERSKALILVLSKSQQLKPFKIGILESLKFAAAITFGGLLLFLLIGSLSYFKIDNLPPTMLTGVEEKNLRSEVTSLDFKIQLEEVHYFDDSAEQVAAVLKEISQEESKEVEELDLNAAIL